MKVKINVDGFGTFAIGEIVEATVSNDGTQCYAFDGGNIGWFFGIGQFIAIEDSEEVKSISGVVSLKDIIGYDVKTIEFK